MRKEFQVELHCLTPRMCFAVRISILKLLQSVTKEADGTLTLTLEDGESLGGFDQVLVAAGREPIVDTLGLDSAGVKTERGYITVRAYCIFSFSKQEEISYLHSMRHAFPVHHLSLFVFLPRLGGADGL